jgi:hypothetical protein
MSSTVSACRRASLTPASSPEFSVCDAVRNLYSILTGFALIYYPFGSGVIHVFPPAFLTFCTLHLIPRKAGTLAWLICFPYLIAMWVHKTLLSASAMSV